MAKKRDPHLTISLSLLMLAAVLLILRPSAHRALLAGGMLFSTLGDMALMNYRGWFSKHTPSAFVTGGVLFMAAHAGYAAAFAVGARGTFQVVGSAAAAALGAAAYASLLVMSRANGCLTGKKAALLLLYAAFEFVDCAFVFAAGAPVAAAGIVLFIVSDYFIGMDKVAGDSRLTKSIWLFYVPGQLLILTGLPM